ncbi:MAG: hypothetical protein ACREIJ_07560 [Nitrospiraceae bacterium]
MVGAIAANLHEGSRSEYLAQYVFASFGTAVSVPHQEDTGIDLYCTLAERIGSRAWPRAYFSVQVKSTMDSWILDSQDSVRWLVEHPLPLFLCVVDKHSARLRVYHTSARFYAWSLPPLPSRLELVPTTDREGRCTQWSGGSTFSLSAPILDATVQDLLDDQFHRTAWEVLRFWIGFDLENLARMRSGIHLFRMPDGYTTNDTSLKAWAIQGTFAGSDLTTVLEHTKECVAYISTQLYNRGDLAGATRCALLLCHFFKDDFTGGTHNLFLHQALNELLAVDAASNYLFRGVDSLNILIDKRLMSKSANEPGTDAAG